MAKKKMTVKEAIAALKMLNSHDVEEAHSEADEVLLAMVPNEVRVAYNEACERIGFWYA